MRARRPLGAALPARRDRVVWSMRAALCLAGALLLAFAAHALTGFGGGSTQRLFATWISDAIVLIAVAVCLCRAALEPRDRAVWALAGIGVASWGAGNAYWEHTLAAGASLPNPSLADVGFLGFYPPVYLAVIAARRDRGRRDGPGLWLDGLIGAAACAALGAQFVLEPVVHATNGESLLGALTNIAYPIGDFTLLAMLVATTAIAGWRGARGLLLLAAGMALFALSDTLYVVENANGSYRAGDVLDAGWLLALLLIALGAATVRSASPRPARRDDAFAPERAIVPCLAGLVALAVLTVQPFAMLSLSGLAFATLTLALVVSRLAISLRETAGLLAARAREAALDPLTGLGNRRRLLADLAAAAATASAERPTLLFLFDLDGFKVYNDTFGHNAGDGMLMQIADALRRALGERGRAYRIGGDEFCALLPSSEESPKRIGEELAAAMSGEGEGVAVTASWGCAIAPADGRETTALLRRADDEMYERKGRRRRGGERARRRLEAQLSYQADHDLLTGLLNRRRFAEELERMLRYAARYRRAGALLMLDVDNLKLVNDLHGHAAGDAALKAVAEEIRRRTRATDVAARLGGDELAIALHEAGEREALAVAEEIRARLAERQIEPALQISIGIAPFDDPAQLVADDLLTAADVALFEAKRAGRNQIMVYRGEVGAAHGWVQAIRDALAEGRFVLYGQPIVELRSGELSHCELLLRMLSADGDVIPPGAFIPTAERFGLIGEIDRWVCREGLDIARRGERVSINISAHSIGDESILACVREASRAGLGDGAVIFEITETAAMSNMEEARLFTEQLGRLGCEVALDDFGTGFGSFSHLKHLPTRYLKIDVEFVRELVSNPTDQQLVRSITEVGHSLGKLIVAEGVEDEAIAEMLRGYGVDYAQGLRFGAPRRLTLKAPVAKGFAH